MYIYTESVVYTIPHQRIMSAGYTAAAHQGWHWHTVPRFIFLYCIILHRAPFSPSERAAQHEQRNALWRLSYAHLSLPYAFWEGHVLLNVEGEGKGSWLASITARGPATAVATSAHNPAFSNLYTVTSSYLAGTITISVGKSGKRRPWPRRCMSSSQSPPATSECLMMPMYRVSPVSPSSHGREERTQDRVSPKTIKVLLYVPHFTVCPSLHFTLDFRV